MDVGSPADGADGAVGSRVHPNVEREERGGPRTPPPLPGDPDLPVERPGLGANVIAALADQTRAQLILTGTLTRALAGSVSDALLNAPTEAPRVWWRV